MPETKEQSQTPARRFYTVWYKKFHRPQESHIEHGLDIGEAKREFMAYCERHKMSFISIIPFLLDLSFPPAPERLPQKNERDETVHEEAVNVLQQKNLVNAIAAARTTRLGLAGPTKASDPTAEEIESSQKLDE